MTFNNLEIPQHAVPPSSPNSYIYDGTDLAIFHDGLHRYIVIKNSRTAVKLKEPYTSSSNYAYVIGDNNSNLYIVNPGLRQVQILTISGVNIIDSVVNLNDYNRFRDVSIIGSNLTQNTFIPQGGGVNGEFVVVGGYLHNAAGGISLGSYLIEDDAMCYMYSADRGASWSGPWFPFLQPSPPMLLHGTIISVVLYQDNWYFQLSQRQGTQFSSRLYVVQALGVDLNGNIVPNSIMETSTADPAVYQLPMLAYNNGIYTIDTARNNYFFYDLTTSTLNTNFGANINNFNLTGGSILITNDDTCTPTTITPVVNTGENTFMLSTLANTDLSFTITPGKVLIDDDKGLGPSFTMLGGIAEYDHFIQPSEVTI